MFDLNKIVTTKKGEKLKPFLVQKGMVYCFDRNGKTVIKKLDDFDHTPEKKKEVIVVTPVMETTDEFYETDEPTDPPPVVEEPIVEDPVVEDPVVEDPPSNPIDTNIPDEDYI